MRWSGLTWRHSSRILELSHFRDVPATRKEQPDPSAELCLGRERTKLRVRMRQQYASILQLVAAWYRWMPHLYTRDLTHLLHHSLAVVLFIQLPLALRLPGLHPPGAPSCTPTFTFQSLLPLAFLECSLILSRSPGCASPVGHLILTRRSPQLPGCPLAVSDCALI